MRLKLLILGSLFSAFAYADIYKCTDANGKTGYRSSPCETEHGNVKLNIKTGTYTPADGTDNQPDLVQKEQQAALEKQKLEQEQLQKKQANINKEAIIESAKNQFLIKNNSDKFSPYAIPPYVPEKLPDLVKLYQTRLADIERLRRQAAEKALVSGQCIRVESVELESKSTKDALMIVINCSSGKSFYFKEQELPK